MGGDQMVIPTYTLSDPSIGSMNQNTFTASGNHGGTVTLTANYNGAIALATIHLKVKATITTACPGCPAFPGDGAPPCTGLDPTVVYPADGVLMPPNLNQLEVHFTPNGAGNLYEVDFQNSDTDVRVMTKCTDAVDTHGIASGGCVLALDKPEWDLIAKSNRGGDSVKVTVRATNNNSCVSTSTSSPMVNFAEEDITGAIYYWKSVVSGGTAGVGGAIYRKSFGDSKPEEIITASSGTGFSATCYGCHFLSRDGARMTVNADDNDSDDEYGDISSGLVDVATKQFITMISYATGQAPGFQTFNHDHSLYLGSSGDGTGMPTKGTATPPPAKQPNGFFVWNGISGNPAPPTWVAGAAMGKRPTMPDWSSTDKNIVYVVPNAFVGGQFSNTDDDHLVGGSLWKMSYGSSMFGMPEEILHSNGENNYYPSYSPDDAFIIFNRVPLQGPIANQAMCTMLSCPNSSFSNPKARVWLLPTKDGSQPVDLEALNGSPAASPVDVSNSWPRWSPFIRSYKGSKLLWVTFSSTRDYGLKVRNHTPIAGMPQRQCYPSYGPEGETYSSFPLNCQQPQVWMAAINLSTAEFASQDPSFPAFYLPFQDIKTHNHTAQWTTTAQPSQPDAGACIGSGEDCTHAPNSCCDGVCGATGTCVIP
jgi:hypothetical protein